MGIVCRRGVMWSGFRHRGLPEIRNLPREVEHHLWPAMSFIHLREASQVLKSACKEFLGLETGRTVRTRKSRKAEEAMSIYRICAGDDVM